MNILFAIVLLFFGLTLLYNGLSESSLGMLGRIMAFLVGLFMVLMAIGIGGAIP
jgi:uncharacterized membrane protein required for colicin V production